MEDIPSKMLRLTSREENQMYQFTSGYLLEGRKERKEEEEEKKGVVKAVFIPADLALKLSEVCNDGQVAVSTP